MNAESVLTNKEIPSNIREAFEECLQPEEQLLFVVVGDLSLKAEYGLTALGVTRQTFMVYDSSRPEPLKKYAHADVASAKVKRMYGNARLRVDFKDGPGEDVFRFTYAVATLAEMAAAFIEKVGGGADALFFDEFRAVSPETTAARYIVHTVEELSALILEGDD